MNRNHLLYFTLSSIPITVVLIYLLSCLIILRILITPERISTVQIPEYYQPEDIQEVAINSSNDGVQIHGWLIEAPSNKVIILIHGIHGSGWHCQAPDYVYAYHQAGFNVLLFDLRGHGISGGDYTGLGIVEQNDISDITNFLLDEGFKPGQIGVHGTSYGAAVALLAAPAIPEIAAVIADSSFADIHEVIGGELQRVTGLPAAMAEVMIPGLRLLSISIYSLDIRDSVPEKVISHIAPRPVLLIHSKEDPTIPYEHAQRLLRASAAPVELWTLPGGHTSGVRIECSEKSITYDAYLEKVTHFFKTHLN